MANEKSLSRRELFSFWRRKPEPPAPVRRAPLRPPGMLHEALLVEHCIRCGKCVEVCPADAILPLGPEWGRAAGTPAIDARKRPCVLCTGLQCTHVCPSGALLPTYVNGDVLMGTAVLDEARCLAHRGEPCDACQKQCPMPGAIVIDPDARVRVVAEKCVGCGLCEHVCPTEPSSIRVVPRE
jgi:MauM/NapG family ferredoxin protein